MGIIKKIGGSFDPNREYATFRLSEPQKTDLATGNAIKIDTAIGNIPLSNYRFVLKANKRYLLVAYARMAGTTTEGTLVSALYNVTDNADLRDLYCTSLSASSTSTLSSGYPIIYVYQPTQDKTIEFRIFNSVNVDNISKTQTAVTVLEI